MKHSKQRNVGIIFEILNHAVLNEISKGRHKTAASIFSSGFPIPILTLE